MHYSRVNLSLYMYIYIYILHIYNLYDYIIYTVYVYPYEPGRMNMSTHATLHPNPPHPIQGKGRSWRKDKLQVSFSAHSSSRPRSCTSPCARLHSAARPNAKRRDIFEVFCLTGSAPPMGRTDLAKRWTSARAQRAESHCFDTLPDQMSLIRCEHRRGQ